MIRVTGDPDDDMRSTRINIEWAREQIKLHGRKDPWVMAYILGQFPDTAINSLLSVEEVEAAMKRHLSEDKFNFSQKRLGIDAARFGDDPWVIFPRQGLAAFRPKVIWGPRSHEVAAVVANAKKNWGSEMELFDDTGGFASGAIDALVMAGHAPVPINFSGIATDPRYFNKRSEMHFLKAAWVKRGGALPYIPELLVEMIAPKYWYDKGKFRIEEKDQIKARIRRSPNLDDALGLTFGLPDMPTAGQYDALIHKRNEVEHEYNPYEEKEKSQLEVEYDPFAIDRR